MSDDRAPADRPRRRPAARARPTSPQSPVVHFGADKPLAARCRRRARAVPDRLPDLRHAQRRPLQRHPGLPCADRRPARRQRPPGHRQARLVGDHGRARQADRHRPLFRHLLQRARRLHGLDRPGLDQSGDRPALRPRLPRHHHPRHGARAGACCSTISASTRCSASSAARWAACRCCNGRRAIPERVFAALPIATRRAPFRAEHRLPRGRPPGGHGRSGLARAATISPRARSPRQGLAVARMAAHITYLSDAALHRKFGRKFQDRDNPTFSFDADFQVESYLRHQGSSFVERFDANSYLYITRAMDYFDLAADYGGVLANAFQGTQDALLRRLLHLRLAVPDRGIARHRARAQRRRRAGVASSRSRPTRATTPSCSTSRSCSPSSRGFLDAAAQARGLRRRRGDELPPDRDVPWPMPRATPSGARVDLLLIADMVEPGVARARRRLRRRRRCCACWPRRAASTAAASSCRARASTTASRKGLSVIQGDADTDLADYPDDAFDYVILSQTLQATRQPARRARAHAAHRPPRHRVVPEFRPLAHARCSLLFARPHAASPTTCPIRWYDTPNIHFCTISDFVELCSEVGAKIETRGGAQRLGRAAAAQRAVVVLEPVRRAGGVPAQPQGLSAALAPGARQAYRQARHIVALQF